MIKLKNKDKSTFGLQSKDKNINLPFCLYFNMCQFFLLAFLEVKLFFLSIDGVSLSSYFVLSLYLLGHQFLSSILLPFRDELQLCVRRIDAKLCDHYLCHDFLKWG